MRRRLLIFILPLLFILIFNTSLFPSPFFPAVAAEKLPPDEMYTRRFAFIAGANFGGPGRMRLRYAINDARALKKVLQDMGGIYPEDVRFLADPNREVFLAELKAMAKKVAQARKRYRRVEVIFYYSGHSDETHLLLDKELVSYKEFRDNITAMNADVRIAILDSCASGAFTQTKGVKRRPPFLLNTAYNMKGNAFMTSSSPSEAAQESRRLKGSYFTHYLVSGMRGAADMNKDGRITLNEAYQFTFDETRQHTEQTVSGPQHPSYLIDMEGTGDVVITEINKSEAVLVLKSDIADKIYIHNSKNVLVIAMDKPPGRDIAIGLDTGLYRIINISGKNVWGAKITLTGGKRCQLDQAQFKKIDKIPTTPRGNKFPILEKYLRKNYYKKFQLEVFGGLAELSPGDLNMRAESDSNFEEFFRHAKYQYRRAIGLYQFFTLNNEGGDFKLLEYAVPMGIRLKYNLNHWLALSLGLSYFNQSETSRRHDEYTIIRSDGTTYIHSLEFSPYTISTSAYIPQIGIHATKNLSRSLSAEAFLTLGPVLAKCEYDFSFQGAPVSDMGIIVDTSSISDTRLEEKGSGTGFAMYAGGRINLDISRNFGIFMEIGYASRTVSNIEGTGMQRYSDGKVNTWSGEWGIKNLYQEREWGVFYSEWPSNYWEEDHHLRRVRDFKLDLSGAQLRIGLYYRF